MKEIITSFLKFIVLFLTPIAPLMLVIGVAVIFDTILGRKAAIHNAIKEGKDVDVEVTSKKTRSGLIPKLISYQTVAITMFVLDDFAINEVVMNYVPFAFLATKIIGGFLIWIELLSINENYKKIKGITINDMFLKYIASIKNLFKNLLTSFKDFNEKK